MLNSTCCDASIFTNKISATTACGIYEKAVFLPLNSSSESKFSSGNSIMGKQPKNIKWKVNFFTFKQKYNLNTYNLTFAEY